MQKLRCVVERITYQNPENGYSVMKVKVKNYSDLVMLVGNMLEVPIGSVLLCEGEWKVDKRYGSQFVAQTWEEVMPATLYGIEKYLGSGLVKGIGPKYAQLIVQKFGLDFHMSNIGKNKIHEDMPNFDEMWGEVQEEIQEKDAEDAVVNRAPELRTLSENIDKATNT